MLAPGRRRVAQAAWQQGTKMVDCCQGGQMHAWLCSIISVADQRVGCCYLTCCVLLPTQLPRCICYILTCCCCCCCRPNTLTLLVLGARAACSVLAPVYQHLCYQCRQHHIMQSAIIISQAASIRMHQLACLIACYTSSTSNCLLHF